MTKQFDPTKPVQRRDGKSARIIATDAICYAPIIALITSDDGGEFVQFHFHDGEFAGKAPDTYDLVNIPQKISGWINIYSNSSPTYSIYLHNTREQADSSAYGGRIACIHVEFEEGEGL
jgi:hypothetical protein